MNDMSSCQFIQRQRAGETHQKMTANLNPGGIFENSPGGWQWRSLPAATATHMGGWQWRYLAAKTLSPTLSKGAPATARNAPKIRTDPNRSERIRTDPNA
jgi:hypothetical protein